jgi:hypothetical protein
VEGYPQTLSPKEGLIMSAAKKEHCADCAKIIRARYADGPQVRHVMRRNRNVRMAACPTCERMATRGADDGTTDGGGGDPTVGTPPGSSDPLGIGALTSAIASNPQAVQGMATLLAGGNLQLQQPALGASLPKSPYGPMPAPTPAPAPPPSTKTRTLELILLAGVVVIVAIAVFRHRSRAALAA